MIKITVCYEASKCWIIILGEYKVSSHVLQNPTNSRIMNFKVFIMSQNYKYFTMPNTTWIWILSFDKHYNHDQILVDLSDDHYHLRTPERLERLKILQNYS